MSRKYKVNRERIRKGVFSQQFGDVEVISLIKCMCKFECWFNITLESHDTLLREVKDKYFIIAIIECE